MYSELSPDTILASAGIVGGETYWTMQPSQTFAAWGDETNAGGSDFDNEIRSHEITIELYELMDSPDPNAHKSLQAALDACGLSWRKRPREVDIQLRLYMTIYTYHYTERR